MIVFERQAAKQIESFDRVLKQRIKHAIDMLPSGDVKKLQGYKGTYRLRVGKYRIIYSTDTETITIKAVLPRGAAYNNI